MSSSADAVAGGGDIVSPGQSVPNEKDDETMEEWKKELTESIMKMMFVSGETAEPSAETTGIIEDIIRQQVIEMVSHCAPPMLLSSPHLPSAGSRGDSAHSIYGSSRSSGLALHLHGRSDLSHPS